MNNLFVKLFHSRRHTRNVFYKNILILNYVMGDGKEKVICYGGKRNDVMRFGGIVIEERLE